MHTLAKTVTKAAGSKTWDDRSSEFQRIQVLLITNEGGGADCEKQQLKKSIKEIKTPFFKVPDFKMSCLFLSLSLPLPTQSVYK